MNRNICADRRIVGIVITIILVVDRRSCC